ncbi:hypothetical protein B194_3334 [Serratia plymuthica A30]|nr:hypothetical protein B194_3334 [Serratia plymuthica A30]
MNSDKSETTFQRMNDRSLSCKEFFVREVLKNTRRMGGVLSLIERHVTAVPR